MSNFFNNGGFIGKTLDFNTSEYYQVPGGTGLNTASYDNISFSVFSQESSPTSLFFKPDGTKMFVLGLSGRDVNEYNLSTAWDVSSASYARNFSVSSQETSPFGLFFKPEGDKMYILGYDSDRVNEYSLSTPWNLSTASYTRNYSVAAQDGFPTGIYFKSDGTKMYMIGLSGDDVNEYNLSTAWNVSTASYVQNYYFGSQESTPLDIAFTADGTKMFIIGEAADSINEYDLSVAWDVSSASYSQNFSVSSQETQPYGLFIQQNGNKMYICGLSNDTVYQYSITLFVENNKKNSGVWNIQAVQQSKTALISN